MKQLLTLCLLLSFSWSFAGDFTFKLDVGLVNHQSPQGVQLTVTHNGNRVHSEEVASDGDVKLKLTEGKLYEVWLVKPGYITHVIHNVHDEGDRSKNITLYKGRSQSAPVADYLGVDRTFDKVKDMTIPEELLGDTVAVIREDDMTKKQKTSLKKVESIAKDQQKAQKKIDKLLKKLGKVEDDMEKLEEELSQEGIDRGELEKKKLKLQEDNVKIHNKMDRLSY